MNNKKAKITIYDEVNIHVKNIDFYTTNILVKRFSFKDKKSYFRVGYTRRLMNAEVSFFKRNGRSYLHLIDGIFEVLEERGYDIEIEDLRKKYEFEFENIDENYLLNKNIKWKHDKNLEGEGILLRDYQADIINKFLNNIQSVQEAATGCGKTLIIATLASLAEKYGRTVTIVPNKNLIIQTARYFDELGLEYGIISQHTKETDKKHIITTWQSLLSIINNRTKEYYKTHYENVRKDVMAVIVDECHISRTDSLRTILCGMFSNVPIRWGLTATLPTDDAEFYSILTSIGPLINTINAKSLQNKGILSSCDIHIIQLEDEGEYENYMTEKKFLMNKERLDFISLLIDEIKNQGNTLVLADWVGTVKYLNSVIPDSFLVHGQINNNKRQAIYDYVKNENNKVILATFGVASVGIDIPRLFNVIMIEPGKSAIRIIQSIGRGLRKAGDKSHLVVYDICSTSKYSSKHMKQRKNLYKKSNYPFTLNKMKWKNEKCI